MLKLAGHPGGPGRGPGEGLARAQGMGHFRGHLAAGASMVGDAAPLGFPGADAAEESLAAVVAVGGKVHDESAPPVLSARYHLFARATEGAFTCLTPSGPHVSLGRREVCGTCQGAMFEFAACKRCGAVHLLGA